MDQPDADELGAAGHLHAHFTAVVVGERIEHSGVSADVDLVAAREIRDCAIRITVDDGHDPARVRIAQGFQHDPVEHAEQRGDGADAEGQRHDGDARESRRPPQPAKRVTDVVHARNCTTNRRLRAPQNCTTAVRLAERPGANTQRASGLA